MKLPFLKRGGRAAGQEKPRDLPRDILRFQPDSVLLERAKPPLGARWTLYALVLFVLLLLLWAIWGRMDRVVMAEGKIVTIDTPLVLQTYNLSVIKDIR